MIPHRMGLFFIVWHKVFEKLRLGIGGEHHDDFGFIGERFKRRWIDDAMSFDEHGNNRTPGESSELEINEGFSDHLFGDFDLNRVEAFDHCIDMALG